MPFERQESETRTQPVDLFSTLLEGNVSMPDPAINVTLAQRLMVCFAWLALMGSGLCTFHPVAGRPTRPPGSV